MHSESGGGRGLAAKDAVCIDLRITVSDLLVYNEVEDCDKKTPLRRHEVPVVLLACDGEESSRRTVEHNLGLKRKTVVQADKLKGPELGISGPCTQRVGDGRGLAARDAVCVRSILAI